MKQGKAMQLVNDLWVMAQKKSPAILSGLSVAGVIATAWYSYKAGTKMPDILERRRKDLKDVRPGDREARKAVNKETARNLLPVMGPPVVMGGITIACEIGSNTVSTKRIKTLSAAYAISESAVKELNGKMIEVLGERKAREVKDAVVKDRLKEKEPIKDSQIIITGDGDVLCMDSFSERIFKSNATKLEQIITKLSVDCQQDMYVSLNDLYFDLGLRQISGVEDFGWSVDDLVKGRLPISITVQLTEDQRPCLYLDYDIKLRPDFRNLL